MRKNAKCKIWRKFQSKMRFRNAPKKWGVFKVVFEVQGVGEKSLFPVQTTKKRIKQEKRRTETRGRSILGKGVS